LTIRIKHH